MPKKALPATRASPKVNIGSSDLSVPRKCSGRMVSVIASPAFGAAAVKFAAGSARLPSEVSTSADDASAARTRPETKLTSPMKPAENSELGRM
ncbi:hypothetical protein D3C87_1818010 [compost metagenome]